MRSSGADAVTAAALAAWPYLTRRPLDGNVSVLFLGPKDVIGAAAKLIAKLWANAFPSVELWAGGGIPRLDGNGHGGDGMRLLWQRFNKYGMGGDLDSGDL